MATVYPSINWTSSSRPPPAQADRVLIALVNGMPAEARPKVERQFREILAAAAGTARVDLACYTLDPNRITAGAGWQPGDWEHLSSRPPDGLIVTGMAVQAQRITDEPGWPALSDLVDLAVSHTIPSVWICLSAHVAVYRLSAISRRRLEKKCFGVMTIDRAEPDHPLMAGMPERWHVPHSRFNDIPEDALRAKGYRILSRSPECGADNFSLDAPVPFLFCQGHPEYDSRALVREYRRDVASYLSGKQASFPHLPANTFPASTSEFLSRFSAQAGPGGKPEPLAALDHALRGVASQTDWSPVTHRLYANWLSMVVRQKGHRVPLAVPAAPQFV